jgi:hypothetical protein
MDISWAHIRRAFSLCRRRIEPTNWVEAAMTTLLKQKRGRNGYAQAEDVANLGQVPETGALVAIGYPKFGGGLGGYARHIAICPPDWPHGVTIGSVPEAPLKRFDKLLHYDEAAGMRVR